MVVGIVAIVVVNGLSTFWPRRLVRYELKDGTVVVGEELKREVRKVGQASTQETQVFLRVGNRDLSGGGGDFRWIRADDIKATSTPERREARLELQEGEMDRISKRQNEVNDELRRFQREADPTAPTYAGRKQALDARKAVLDAEFEPVAAKVREIVAEDRRHLVLLEDGAGNAFPKPVPMSQILRIDAVNALSFPGRVGLAVGRFWRFVTEPPREANTDGGIWPAIYGTVLMTLIMTMFVVPFGVLAALYLREYAKQGTLVRIVRIAVNNLAGVPSIVFGVFGLGFFVYTVGGNIDRLFFPEALPTPTFGTGGILWGALTLALLTVPVVIVATEEGLAAVPQIVRAGSLALGATKWETTWKVVLPAAAPGILTGVILAMARAAGEVAPLMIVGMVKLAPTLPIDGDFPFVHFERKFMHLGFHIYDVGFQSPNVDATKPLVFATALLLILVVTAMNLVAISIRNRLRRKYAGSAV